MALEFVDGFDSYTSSSGDEALRWDIASGYTPAAVGRYGGNAITGLNMQMRKAMPNAATRTLGCSYKNSRGSWSAGQGILRLFDAGTIQIEIQTNTSGALVIFRGGTAIATSSNVMSLNTWYVIELQATIDPSAGYAEVRVNGVMWANFTGNTRQTANSYSNQIGIAFATSNGDVWLDDFYCRNDTTWMGELSIPADLPNAEGDTQQWTPNSGTAHFSRVNEASAHDSDTSYLSDLTPGNVDLFKFAARTIAGSGSVVAIAISYYARKDDVGTRQIAEACKSGGSVFAGATQTMAGGYNFFQEIRETDPATSAAWATSAVGASGAQFGVKTIA